jgi:hypothetical protein
MAVAAETNPELNRGQTGDQKPEVGGAVRDLTRRLAAAI